MQSRFLIGRIIATFAIMLVAAETLAQGKAIAEDPEFRAAWEAYKEMNPEARMHQMPLSAFPVSSFHSTVDFIDNLPEPQATPQIKANHPEDICSIVRSHVKYTPDEIDYWQTLEETWSRKAGDCEDFAIAVRDLCLANGFHAEIFIFHAKNREAGHAVVIGEWNGIAWMSSNGDYRNITSLANARESMVREFQWHFEQVATYHFTKGGRLLTVDTNEEFNVLYAKSSPWHSSGKPGPVPLFHVPTSSRP